MSVDLHAPPPGRRAFGYELHLVRVGAFAKAVQCFYGLFGDELREDAKDAQAQAEQLTRTLAQVPTAHAREGVASLHYMLAAELRKRGHHYRATGTGAFFGQQHVIADDGTRTYLPREHQGGLAERLGVCVRTVYRYWRILVDGGVWATCRPPRHAPDAVLTRTGSQVYSQRWLAGGTPRAVLERLPARDLTRRPRRPDAESDGRHMRGDEWREASAYLDGEDVPY